MKLKTYLEECGGGMQLAHAVGVSPVVISQWKTGARQVPAERCPSIEKATCGAVRCEELRPDVDWGFLRATDCGIEKLDAGNTGGQAHAAHDAALVRAVDEPGIVQPAHA